MIQIRLRNFRWAHISEGTLSDIAAPITLFIEEIKNPSEQNYVLLDDDLKRNHNEYMTTFALRLWSSYSSIL